MHAKTCKYCKHFHREINPNDVSDKTGQCRRELFAGIVTVLDENRQPTPTPMAYYPGVPMDWPACSHFQKTNLRDMRREMGNDDEDADSGQAGAVPRPEPPASPPSVIQIGN